MSICNRPKPPKAELDRMWAAYLADRASIDARNDLVEAYLPLVTHVAGLLGSKLPACVEHDDLFSWGVFGLMQAIAKFDPSRAASFTTYAARRVYGSMIDELREANDRSRLMLDQSRKLIDAESYLLAALGQPPTDQEMIDHLKVTPEKFKKMVWAKTAGNVNKSLSQSLKYKPDDVRTTPLGQQLVDEKCQNLSQTVVDHTYVSEAKQYVWEHGSVSDLTLFGFYYERGLSMRQIGEFLGVSESLISQRHKKLIRKLRIGHAV